MALPPDSDRGRNGHHEGPPPPSTGPAASASRPERIARFAPANILAALWALRALRAARREISSDGLGAAEAIPAAPSAAPAAAVRGVRAVLSRLNASCLERAMLLQAWYRAHGEDRELVVGVTAPGGKFRAHAWIAGEGSHDEQEFVELARRPA